MELPPPKHSKVQSGNNSGCQALQNMKGHDPAFLESIIFFLGHEGTESFGNLLTPDPKTYPPVCV